LTNTTNCHRKQRENKEEERKQVELKEEEIRMMRNWSEEESQKYIETFRGYRGDTRCRKYG